MMLTQRTMVLRATLVMIAMLGAAYVLHAGPPDDVAGKPRGDLTVAAARERAELLHEVYAATLHVLHERYFHTDRAMVPARAMEDIFTAVAAGSKAKPRWISVNTRAMSLGHEPQTEFEKSAAQALADGKPSVERVEQGVYFRAAPIPLSGGCVSCHTGFFAQQPKSPRFAGLVIGIPIQEK